MIIFHSIRWKNFLATGNYWLEIQLDQNQNTLIIGKNGSGKSTMLDAICFALFGVPFRKINKPTLVNSSNQKNCIVELSMTIDNHNYKMIRGISPNIFEIYKDGILEDQSTSSEDYQTYFEKYILKCNFKSFTQIVILGSASFIPFMQLKASDRRSVIEDLLDIQVFSVMNGITKKKLSNIKEILSTLKIKIDTAKEKEELQQSHIKENKENKEELIREYYSEIEKSEKNIEKLKLIISEEEVRLNELLPLIENKEKISASIKKYLQTEAQLKQTVNKHEKTKDFLNKNEICPTCSQTIEESFREDKLGKITDKTNQCSDALKQISSTLDEKQKELAEINSIEQKIALINTNITSSCSSIEELNKNIKRYKIKIKELETKVNQVENGNEKLIEIQTEIKNFNKQYEFHVNEKQYLETVAELLKDTGIKTKIIKQYLPIINTLTNKHLTSLDFFVNFHLDETFKESIKSRYRDEFSYYSFSQGQKMRIDMALMLTWRSIAKLKNSINTNLLILDEIFDSSLDNSGADELMKILTTLEGNIFVISHRGDVLSDKFQHTIKFTEQQNFSRIV